jgi:transcriptional regulator with XRE-family HTH domain
MERGKMHKKDTYNLAIGLVLQELHDERLLPREKIAEALELSELAVSRVEHGAETLSAGGLMLVLDLFDISWEDFIARVRGKLAEAEARIR